MNTFQFINAMTGHLAWPLAAVLLGLVFRRPLTELLDRIRRLKWGEKEAELAAFADATQGVEDAIEAATRPLPANGEESSQQNRERVERLVKEAASWGFEAGKIGSADLCDLVIDWDAPDRPRVVLHERHALELMPGIWAEDRLGGRSPVQITGLRVGPARRDNGSA